MKKQIFLTIASVALLSVYSCGGGDTTSSADQTESTVNVDETLSVDDASTELEYTSADEAVNAYAEMMEEYERLLGEDDQDAADLYLDEISNLENYINSSFADETELLENMMDMTQGIMDLQELYLNDVMEGMENIPGMEEAQEEMNKAMEDAQKQMDDAMKGINY